MSAREAVRYTPLGAFASVIDPKGFGNASYTSKYSTNAIGSDADISEFLKATASNGVNTDLLRSHTYTLQGTRDQQAGTSASLNAQQDAPAAAFNAWKTSRDNANKQHKEYLNRVKDSPGRAGTILVPTTPTSENPSLLGNNKSILGGYVR